MRSFVTQVGYVGLAVTNFEQEAAFLEEDWRLEPQFADNEMAYYSAYESVSPYLIRLRRGTDRRMDVLSFRARDRDTVDAAARHVAAEGVRIISEPAELAGPGSGYGFRFFDIDGRTVELASFDATKPAVTMPSRSGVPLGLSHAVFHTPAIAETVAFYERVLLMKVSDWLDGFMCFLRGDSRKHHCLAFLPGPASLNHIAFEMHSTDEMMRGMGRVLKSQASLNWGPGRHTAGDNTFAYFETPGGNILEYTAELEEVGEDWQPRTFPRRPDIIDQWGTSRMVSEANYGTPMADPGLWQAGA